MLDGKMLRGLTGTPMRRMLRANISLAEAEPEPLTFANLTTKSLTASIRGFVVMAAVLAVGAMRRRLLHAESSGHGHLLRRRRTARTARTRLRQAELLHVPRAGRAALGAEAAVQADVLVLDHH